LGANRRAAELTGIPARRYVLGAFVCSGVIVAGASVVLASRLQIGTVSTGPDYLLPVFVGALLGSTTIKPGRANAWGTVIAVMLLGIGIAGLQQMGGSYFIVPLFNGSTLILGVGLAGWASRRVRRARPVLREDRGDRPSARGVAPPTPTSIVEKHPARQPIP
jgi:ribose transport system permease protein